MKPLPFVWPYALVYWTVVLWAFWPEFRIVRQAEQPDGARTDKSLKMILRGTAIAYLAAYLVAWVPATQVPRYRTAIFVSGVAVLIAGSLLRRHCWRMLGASFTGDVRARTDQQVVTRGAYALIRHPSYTAGILMNTGIGIALGSWASSALLIVVSFVVYRYRILVEEQALLAAIGEPYRRFMSTRKRLIPFVY
jgi:protein-S-isoprenylcysteine O-methyltransferase